MAPAALLAAKVTVPEVVPRSAATAVSVLSGALQATATSAATAFDNVTVKTALPPSKTFEAGPLMESSAVSLSPGVVVPLSSSVRVTVAELTVRLTVVLPGTVMVSSPSTTVSSVGVRVMVPVPLVELAGMEMEASDVAV